MASRVETTIITVRKGFRPGVRETQDRAFYKVYFAS